MHTWSLDRCIRLPFTRAIATATFIVLCAAELSQAQEYRAVPGLRIQVTNRNHPSQIGSVSSVVQLSNGSIVIADNTNLRVHYFTAAGKFVRSVGRDGEDAGEFKTVRWVGECARDAVYAFDYELSRITVFAPDGTLVRSFSPPNGETAIVRCAVDGTMAYASVGDLLGTVSRGAVQLYSGQDKLLFRSNELMLDEGRPLGKSIKFSVADGAFIYGVGDSAFVTMQTITGTGRKKLPAGIPGRTPTDANRTAAIEYWSTYLRGGPREVERLRQSLKALPPVKTVPAYSDMFLDGVAKAVWVQTSVLADAATELQRIGFDGKPQGKVSLPPNLIIQQIRGDVLVAKTSNAVTGDELVVTYRLVAPVR